MHCDGARRGVLKNVSPASKVNCTIRIASLVTRTREVVDSATTGSASVSSKRAEDSETGDCFAKR